MTDAARNVFFVIFVFKTIVMRKIALFLPVFLLSVAAMAQGSLNYEGNTVTVLEPGANVSTTPVIADESICGERFTETVVFDQFPARRRNLRYVGDFQDMALAQLARDHDADFIITTQVNVSTRDGCFAVTVTGYPAKYVNFRKPTKEDMDLVWKAKAPGYVQMFGYGTDAYDSHGRTSYVGLLEIPRFRAEPGFQQMVEASLMVTDDMATEISYSAGYRFGNCFYLGGGTGIGYSFWTESAYVPVFVNPVFYLSDRRVTPTVGLRLGACAVLEKHYGDSIVALVEVRPGISVHLNNGNDVNIGITLGSRPDVYFDDMHRTVSGGIIEGGLSVGFSF